MSRHLNDTLPGMPVNGSDPKKALFREEVVADTGNRLHGHIILRLSLTSRMMVAAIVAIMAVAVVLVTTGEYARTQAVRGFLVTTDPSVQIFPLRPGQLAQFDLAEGERVRAGQAIALVDTDVISPSGEGIAETVERSMDHQLALAHGDAAMIRQSTEAQRSQLQDRVASFDRQIASLDSQIAIQKEIVESNRELYAKIENLVDRGFVSQIEYQRRRQNVLVADQSLARLEQSKDELVAQRNAAQIEKLKLASESQQRLSQLDGSISSLEGQRAQYAGEKSYAIRAPISGRVTAIQTARGRRAIPSSPILTIIPEGAELRARLFAPSNAIGMVKRHQKTTLLLDAFPYQRFGSIKAEIVEISRTVIDPKTSEIPIPTDQPVYLIEASLERQSMSTFGQDVPLQPGMMLTANIVLEKQSFLDWMLSPLRAVLNRT